MQSGTIADVAKKAERLKMIEELKKPLHMPMRSLPKKDNKNMDMDKKYVGTFGFGTPTIRANARTKHMNQDQLRSLANLQRISGNLMAGGQSKEDDERDSNNFRKVSAANFLKRTQLAEVEQKQKGENDSNREFNLESQSKKFNQMSSKKDSVLSRFGI